MQKKMVYSENVKLREAALAERLKAAEMQLQSEVFAASSRMASQPTQIRFHPYDVHLAVADSESIG